MLPERAFQPRGPYGMTLEGGGGGIVGDILGGIGDAVSGAVDAVGDVISGTVDFVQDVGGDIDDFVNEEIPGGWVTVAAVGTGMYLGGAETAALSGATEAGAATGTAAGLGAADAVTAAEWFGGAGAATTPGAIFGSAAPSAGLLGGAAELASVGETMAPVAGPSNVLEYGFPATEPITPVSVDVIPGYATPENVFEYGFTPTDPINPIPVDVIPASNISLRDAFQGAKLVSGLLTPQQQAMPQQMPTSTPQGNIDYSQLLGLLSQRANATGLLGTRFQPQPINLASLLG